MKSKPEIRSLSIYLDKPTYQKLVELANKEKRSLSAQVGYLITQTLNKNDK